MLDILFLRMRHVSGIYSLAPSFKPFLNLTLVDGTDANI
jgi:hypothetical protein